MCKDCKLMGKAIVTYRYEGKVYTEVYCTQHAMNILKLREVVNVSWI